MRSGQPDAPESAGARHTGHHLGDVQPRQGQLRLDQWQGLMDGVVRTDQEVRPAPGQLVGRGKHERADARPVFAIQMPDVFGQRMRVHGDFRMRVGSKKLRALGADGAIAKRRALRGAGYDADVSWHALHASRSRSTRLPPIHRVSIAERRRGTVARAAGKNEAIALVPGGFTAPEHDASGWRQTLRVANICP